MTADELRKILNDHSEIDPWLVENFYHPFEALGAAVDKHYLISSPPARYWEGREFAISLWECSDGSEMLALASAFQEGASQLYYLLGIFIFHRHLARPTEREGIDPTERKPFAAIASRALEWLDEIEAKAPGKTQRPG